MSIFFYIIDSKDQIMTSQFHNLDQKFSNSIFCTCLGRAQQEELKAENRLFISQKLKER